MIFQNIPSLEGEQAAGDDQVNHQTLTDIGNTYTTLQLTMTDARPFLEVSLGTSHIHVPIEEDTIDSSIFAELNLSIYDNGYINTAVCRSAITYIDGDAGILRYRGYPIDVLAEKSNFLEVAFLLIYGELPTASQYSQWSARIMRHTYIHENMVDYLKVSSLP